MTLREVTAAQVALVPMATYYAKLQLTGLEATFGNAGMVRSKFEDLGFGSVTVWDSGPPDDFPDRTPFPDGATYWAKGLWSGGYESKALPAQVKRVWTDAPASSTAPGASPPKVTPKTPPGASPAPDGASWTAPTLNMPDVTITSSSNNTGMLVLLALAAFAFSER